MGVRTSIPAPTPASGDSQFRHSLASLAAPADGALAKDLQAWRRAITMAKVQHEYNSNHLMNLEVQQEMMAQKGQGQGQAAANVVGDIWLTYNQAVEASLETHCESRSSRTKRELDEVNRTRYVEQSAAGAELAKLHKRRRAAEANCVGIVDALTSMGAALPPPEVLAPPVDSAASSSESSSEQ